MHQDNKSKDLLSEKLFMLPEDRAVLMQHTQHNFNSSIHEMHHARDNI